MISISHPATGPDFVNRRTLLQDLHAAFPHENVALIGLRRIGKSSVAEEFIRTLETADTVKFIFDVQGNMGTPGKFAVRLLLAFLKSYLLQVHGSRIPELDDMELKPAILLEAAERIKSSSLSDLARFLTSYFPPSPDEDRPVLEKVLRFIDAFSTEKGIKTAVVLDEFQAILNLGEYKGFAGGRTRNADSTHSGTASGKRRRHAGHGKVLGFLQSIISEQENVWYLFTGSAVRMMSDILESADSPFYGRVRPLNVQPFAKDDAYELVHRCAGKPITGDALNLMFNLSNGHPFYMVVITTAAAGLSGESPFIRRENVEEAFVVELARGTLCSHCRYLFETSLGRAGESSLLKEILRELSAGELSLTELARKMGRETGYLSLPLSRLYHLDLIERKGKQYQVSDPILQVWLSAVHGQNEARLDTIRRRITDSHRECIEAMKTEMGALFESHLREMLRRFDGRSFGGFRLPRFSTVDSGNAYDEAGAVFGKPSNIEIDALCTGEENWICEFKYRNRLVERKDVEVLMKKGAFFQAMTKIPIHRLMYVAHSGFTEKALASGVWCVTLRELDRLLSMLNMKRTGDILHALK